MTRKQAWYSLVQYVPHGGRAEGANAGVVVFVPDTGEVVVRTSPDLSRIKQFFAPNRRDLRRIELAVQSFKHRLEATPREFSTAEEFNHFVAARADAVRLTPPKLVVLSDVQQTLDELYQNLVGSEPRKNAMNAVIPALPSRVTEIFGRLEAQRRVWQPGVILVPETGRKLRVPIAYQNGRMNYIVPQSLARSAKPDTRLPRLGFDGLLIHQHPIDGEEGRLVVLSVDDHATPQTEARFAEVLKEFHVRFVSYLQVVEFAQEVEQTAHEWSAGKRN